MQAEPYRPSETKFDGSQESEEVSSNDSSYGEKVSSQPIGSQTKHVLPSNKNAFEDLSTTNFHFEIEESFLPQPKTPGKPSSVHRQPYIKDSPLSKSTNPNDQIDDEVDLKELLKLLQDAQQYEQSPPKKDYEPPRKNLNTRPLKQVKVQNLSQKIKSPKNKDNFKKPKNEFPQPHQLENPQRFEFHRPNLLPQNHVPFQQMMHYPPAWNQWQQIQNREPFQKPYFQKPMKSYQVPMAKKPYQDEFTSQNFVFRNVLITIKLCSFLSLKKNVLLAPFSSSNLDDKISRVITKRLKYNIREILYVQASKTNQKEVQDGYVFSVKAKGLEKNYRGIYFVKSPAFHSQEMKYYSVGMLQSSVKRIFDLVDEHMEKEIVFPDFQWGSLSQHELCENLIWSIFREISEQKKNYRCVSLKEVIMSVNSCENFELYSKCLKSYVQQLRN